MHWRFDPLFSIKIINSKAPDNPAGEFSLEPTHATANRMKALGWISKNQAGFCAVYGEKIFDADGQAKWRSSAAVDEYFTFFLKLNNTSMLPSIKPYNSAGSLPLFSGRSRILYFDNLNPTPVSGGEFSISTGMVDMDQFASAAPPKFTLVKAKTEIDKLRFTALTPLGTISQIALNPQSKTAQVELAENAYRLEQTPGGPTETLLLMSENIRGNVLGVVRIFGPGAGSWEPARQYRIDFERI